MTHFYTFSVDRFGPEEMQKVIEHKGKRAGGDEVTVSSLRTDKVFKCQMNSATLMAGSTLRKHPHVEKNRNPTHTQKRERKFCLRFLECHHLSL